LKKDQLFKSFNQVSMHIGLKSHVENPDFSRTDNSTLALL